MVEVWEKTRDLLYGSLMKDFGKESIGIMKAKDFISTGSLGLDATIGIGGIPVGVITEIYGPTSGGKTMLTYAIIANAQKKFGRPCAIIDAEVAFNDVWARTLGVNLDMNEKGDKYKLLDLCYPADGDKAFDMIEKMASSGVYSVIVVDSVVALTPEQESESNTIDAVNRMGLLAKLMGVGLRKVKDVLYKTGTSLVFINQIRDSMAMYGDSETTPGGHALRFYASLRIRVNKVGQQILDASGAPAGHTINTKVKKNRFGAPLREAEFSLYYYRGLDKIGEMFKLGKQYDVIAKRDNAFWIGEKKIASSKYTIRADMKADPILEEEVRLAVLDKMVEQLHPRQTAFEDEAKPESKVEALNPDEKQKDGE